MEMQIDLRNDVTDSYFFYYLFIHADFNIKEFARFPLKKIEC